MSRKTKCSVFVGASVDGFIAGAGGDISWLERPEFAESKINGLSYGDFISGVDAIVMGRNTFETALGFPKWPYEGTPVIMLSSKAFDIPARLAGKVEVDSGTPQEIVSRQTAKGRHRLYVDGGVTVQRFLAARLINEITITRLPILLGRGIPLFGSEGGEQDLRLIEATVSESGVVQERYVVSRMPENPRLS